MKSLFSKVMWYIKQDKHEEDICEDLTDEGASPNKLSDKSIQIMHHMNNSPLRNKGRLTKRCINSEILKLTPSQSMKIQDNQIIVGIIKHRDHSSGRISNQGLGNIQLNRKSKVCKGKFYPKLNQNFFPTCNSRFMKYFFRRLWKGKVN